MIINDTKDFEYKVYFENNQEDNTKKVIFKNFRGDVVHTTKYRTRKIKQSDET